MLSHKFHDSSGSIVVQARQIPLIDRTGGRCFDLQQTHLDTLNQG